ncbi:SulP family inorganic anion transporter [Prauserella halophila]|uniref:carbonic anhydrase n=1 Tax=Prauserella halophila TaxID=185641 RepID=A0ABP4GVA7_9PSEU|nr:bifunctional SulP family inorganic anion transporter/carbonic anhydrase [Prauserella halophila]MCP2234826.1 carbonic anhydrase [Prauserella halophila]
MTLNTGQKSDQQGGDAVPWWRTVLRYDVPASLVVFLVAVPLSLGIALASGAPVVAGLIAAVVGGIVAGAAGGSPLQVSGPAAGLTVIMAETITQFGWAVTCAITVAAGLLQVLFGLSRVARAALAISPAIVHGMLAGIGITIVLGQLHIVLGGDSNSSAVDNIVQLPGQLVDLHGPATFLGLLTLGILLAWSKLPAAVRKVPAPLAAIVLVTVLAALTGAPAERVELPSSVLDIRFAPELPSGGWADVAVAVLTIALIASIESLLSAVAVDKMHTGRRGNFDRELIGQGLGNVTSGVLGGLPITGVIVRSSTNVAAGARTRASAILHGAWVLLFTALLATLIESIPLAALAGLLVHVGAKLVNTAHIREVLRHGDLSLYVVTVAGVVLIDLLSGVLIGVGLSVLLMLHRTMWSGVHSEGEGDTRRIVIEGALTFLSVPRLSAVLNGLPERATVTLELVVDYLDHAAFDCLHSWQEAHERAGGRVIVDEIGNPWFGRGKDGSPIVRKDRAGAAVPRWLAPWSEWMARDGAAEEASPEVAIPDQRHTPSRPTPLRRGTSEFQTRTAPLVRGTMSRLAAGQHPHTLFITCADARIVPNVITTSGPGDMFTVRNVGNLVPPHETHAGDGAAVWSSVEFAVGVLGVSEIVVCGHSSCGAMRALLDGAPEGLPGLARWLEQGAAGPARRREAGPVRLDGAEPAHSGDALALHNVFAQLDHLRESPLVRAAVERGELTLTGMYLDLGSAQVYLLDPASGDFEPADVRGAAQAR